MPFVSRFVAAAMSCLLLSDASAAPAFEAEAICRAAIGFLMDRDPKAMQVSRIAGDVIFLTYLRPIDNFVWTYRCRIDGNRVAWGSEPGRWRDQPSDAKVSFEIVGAADQLRIIENRANGAVRKQLFDRAKIL
jgi:hypothetical protein